MTDDTQKATDDLVMRLRELSGKYDECGMYVDITIEAADRIQQLEREKADLRAMYDNQLKTGARPWEERDTANTEADTLARALMAINPIAKEKGWVFPLEYSREHNEAIAITERRVKEK